MTTYTSAKKPARNHGWHVADIKAALEKKGYSLARLSRKNDYCRTAAAIAIYRPWPKMERLIADAIGVEPREIWPSRYDADGNALYGYQRRFKKPSIHQARGRRNVESQWAN